MAGSTKIRAAKNRLQLTNEQGQTISVPFQEDSSLLSPGGRAAIRIAGELARGKAKVAETKATQGKL